MFKDELTEVSDTLIKSNKLWINFDKFKNSKRKWQKYKSVDSILFNKTENKFHVIFFEFKRCDLFYKNTLDVREKEIVESIIKDVPEKILDSRIMLIHEYFNKKYDLERECMNIKPVKIELILGNDCLDERGRMRERETIKENRENLKRLKKELSKYTNTYLFSCLDIITANQFKKKYKIN